MNTQETHENEGELRRSTQAQNLPSYSQSQNIPLYNQQSIPIQPCFSNLNQPQVLPFYTNQPQVFAGYTNQSQGYNIVMHRTKTYLIWSVINTIISGIFFYRYSNLKFYSKSNFIS